MMKKNFIFALVLTVICFAAAALFSPVIEAQNTAPQKQKAELYVQTGHNLGVKTVAFSPDGKILASGSSDNTIKLWNIETGQELRTLAGDSGFVNSVAFSPDGKTLATAGLQGIIKLWNVETGQELGTIDPCCGVIESLAFSPDGKMLGSADGTIKLLNVETGQVIRTLAEREKDIRSFVFSPDSKIIASAGRGTIKLWSVETGQELQTLLDPAVNRTVAFSPDGKTLASGSGSNLGSGDRTVKLWSVETGQQLQILSGHTNWVNSVAFSPDGKTLASGSGNTHSTEYLIKLWNIETGRELRTLLGHTGGIESVAFSPDGKTLASGSFDKTVKLWNTETGTERQTLSGHSEDTMNVAFSPDGKNLAAGNRNGTIKLWNTEAAQLRTLSGQKGNNNSVEFSPDGKILASANEDKTIKLWSVEIGQEIRTFAGHTNAAWSAAFSPDGKTIVSTGADKTIRLWSVETGQELHTLTGHTKPVSLAAFSPDGKIIVSSSYDQTIKLWSVETGAELRTISSNSSGFGVAFSPDGKTIASGHKGGTIKLWNVETGAELQTLAGHKIYVTSVAFSADGKALASRGDDGKINLWHTETGQLIKSFDQDDPNTTREVFKAVPDFMPYSNLSLKSLEKEPITKNGRFQIKQGENDVLNLHEVSTGKLLISLVALDETGWAVVTPDGLFDGSPNAWKLLSWRLSDKLYNIVPVEAFFNEFYRPNLLPDIFAGKLIEKPTRDISTIDIRQPAVKVKLSNAKPTGKNIPERQITVNVEIEDAPADEKRKKTSGAKDVRLFRNGSLVKLWSGDVLKGKQSVTLTATIPIVAGDNNFTAYAFNNENVKSRDGELMVKGANSLKRKGKLQILSVGVNIYQNESYNLKFAVADAVDFGAELRTRQINLNNYDAPEVLQLTDREATKQNILYALEQFAKGEQAKQPKNIPAELRTKFAAVQKTQPEDVLVIYFAGHGTAYRDRFYLIPHDGFPANAPNEAARINLLLKQSVSDLEIESVLRDLDAGKLLLIVDACNSGQALESEEKRRGPMNSRGLAQLAYEKGMYILTAAQSQQAALEVSKLGHGLLTFSLLQGLSAADKNGDKQIVEREWFDFAAGEVPKLQLDEMQKHDAEAKQNPAQRSGIVFINGDNKNLPPEKRGLQSPRVFYRRESETSPPLVIAKP